MYNVMVVDDEPLVREFLKMHISRYHPDLVTVAEAMDGQEAWDKLQKERVELIITDIKMPVVDGMELCRRVAQTDNPPIVLILSGLEDFSMAQEAIRHGVHNYLLKPVKKDELIDSLNQITAQLDQKSCEELAYLDMKKVSKDSQTQVVKQFLKALISDSSVEIKALYPLVFRLKVPLIETEGIIMVIDLDEEQLALKGIPYGDISNFRFILNQIAAEISEEGEGDAGYVFLDEEQNTCVLATGEDKGHIAQKCRLLYDRVASAMLAYTGITVSGALGSFESELFHLQASYMKANHHLLCRLFSDGPTLVEETNNDGLLKRCTALDQTLTSIQFALLDQNEIAYSTAVNRYAGIMEGLNVSTVLKFGIHLIRRLSDGTNERKGYLMEGAYRHLQRICLNSPAEWSNEAVLALFREILDYFVKEGKKELVPENEQDIVSRVKSYIYNHYSEPLSLALLAEKLGISPSYLSNVFHKTVQEPYIKFLTRVRMEQAAKLLKATPPEKVYDVSEKVGYVSVKHFSHVFKQHYHMPPGEFQEKHLFSIKDN